jgi:GTP-binding protein
MQFIYEAIIFVKSGFGGNGCLSFRREANVPKGGPDGGNGGRGGSVILRCVPGLNTLIDFRYQQHFKAKRGAPGEGGNRHGAKGKDTYIDVPIGTQIFDENQQMLIVDFTEAGQEFVLAKGGDGGFGNSHFKSSTNQAPRKATQGHPGEEAWVWLKLKLLSDAGLVGLPNAGKSTFLSVVSRAKPKIADYPFTTLKPQLGVVYVDEEEFVIADIPGLIEGAHKGVGLGIRFLKHIERCRVILHLIDVSGEDVVESYQTIRNEIESYSQDLLEKPEVIALTKCDLVGEEELREKVKLLESCAPSHILPLSSVAQKGVTEVLRALNKHVRPQIED